MKLFEVINTNPIFDEIENYLQSETFSSEIEQALANIPGDMWDALCRHPILVAAAEDSYDYSTDYGPSIDIGEDAVMAAIEDVSGR